MAGIAARRERRHLGGAREAETAQQLGRRSRRRRPPITHWPSTRANDQPNKPEPIRPLPPKWGVPARSPLVPSASPNAIVDELGRAARTSSAASS